MTGSSLERKINWELPLVAATITFIALIALIAYTPYSGALCGFFIAPITTLIFLVLLVICAVRKKSSLWFSLLMALLAFFVVSGALLWKQNMLRDHARWLLRSHQFKAEIMAQPNSANGDLKHIECRKTPTAILSAIVWLCHSFRILPKAVANYRTELSGSRS